MADRRSGVGPVLEPGEVGDAVIAAIAERHPELVVEDRGAYRRVLVAGRCAAARAAIEAHLGRPFTLPGDLELVMPSFKGMLRVTADEVSWEAAG
jgi:toluene monooxygenase system protein D